MQAYAFSFTTGFSASTSAPQVTGVSPSNGLTGVPLNAQITVAFNEPLDAESLGGVTLAANGTSVAIASSLSNGNQLLKITPAAGLAPNTAYTLTIAGVTDLSGNALSAPVTSKFTTSAVPDFSQATVTSINPPNGATGIITTSPIQIQFSKYMDSLSINGLTVAVTTNGQTQVQGTFSVNLSGTSVTFTPSKSLSTLTVYSIGVTTGVVDLGGESVTASQFTFTTGSQ